MFLRKEPLTLTILKSHILTLRLTLRIGVISFAILAYGVTAAAENNFQIDVTDHSPITKSASLVEPVQHAIDNVQWFSNQSKLKLNIQNGNRELFQGNEPSFGFALPDDFLCHESDEPSASGANECSKQPPLWHNNDGLTDHGRALVELLSNLNEEGIDSTQFADKRIRKWLKDNKSDDPQLVESMLDNSFNQIAHVLGSGLVDPLVAQKEWDRAADTVDPIELKKQIRSGNRDVASALDGVRPQHPSYKGLKDMLKELRSIDPADQIFVTVKENLQHEDINPAIVDLKQVLLNSGDLTDITYPENEFDSELKAAVTKFQKRHGLEQSGVFNAKTRDALNTPVAKRIQQVKANLERWRWFPANLEDTHVLVNIPEYSLSMTHRKNKLFSMDVVVGTPRHMTPVFSETMKHVVFAPTWTVPSSITNEELIPLELRSPGYLEKEEIDFYQRTENGLHKVERSDVDISSYKDQPFPYTLRQRAGDKNVLGRVKFLMPNKHAVYLHDTKAKKLFDTPQRAYSHGCIRLSNPDMMAYVIMQLEGHSQEVAKDHMAATNTTRIDLDNQIPVHLAYFTAWQDSDGQMHFREDIYGQDKRLIEALEKQGQSGSKKL